MKRLAWTVLVSVALGLIAGFLICGIALEHNPQGEFRDTFTSVIDWPYLLTLGGLTAMVGAATAIVPVSIAVLLVGRGTASIPQNPAHPGECRDPDEGQSASRPSSRSS